jgi:hypothetical protein
MGDLANATYIPDMKRPLSKRARDKGEVRMQYQGFYLNHQRREDPSERLDSTGNPYLQQGRFSLVSWGKRNHSLVEWVD